MINGRLTLSSIVYAFLPVILPVILAALFLQAAPACADEVKAGDLVITAAWSRATPKGAKVGGSYVTVENKGSAADKLIGASSDAAGSIQVHEMSMDGGVMKMRPLESGLVIDP